MARLSKHGTELLRVAKEQQDVTDPNDSCTWRRWTRAYMSDGTVLSKFDVQFKPTPYRTVGEMYSYGWKVHGKVKSDRTPQQAVANIAAAINKGESKWKIVSGGPAPVIISQRRIMAAIESGDHVGFCKACGSESHGVEPDARGYRCESCNMSEVYGAEEMLIAG